MMRQTSQIIPARMLTGLIRSVLPFSDQDVCDKLAIDSEGDLKDSMVVEHLRIGSVNVRTMSGRSVEIDELLSSRHLDFRCLQETRCRGRGTRCFRESTFFWIGYGEWHGCLIAMPAGMEGKDKIVFGKSVGSQAH